MLTAAMATNKPRYRVAALQLSYHFWNDSKMLESEESIDFYIFVFLKYPNNISFVSYIHKEIFNEKYI